MNTAVNTLTYSNRSNHGATADLSAYVNAKQIVHANGPFASANKLLAGLSPDELLRLQCNLEPVDLARDQVLYECGGAVKHIYFPTTSIVSLMCNTLEGGSCEIAMVGNDGAAGISTFMGAGTLAHTAVVYCEGRGFRMKASLMQAAFDRSKDIQLLLLRYTQALMTQISQTAVCIRHYSIDQQLSRRLLMAQDRLATNELSLTQESLGTLLGVRRETISEASNKLQDAGLIQYCRGLITIKDRVGLERRCREIYTPMPSTRPSTRTW